MDRLTELFFALHSQIFDPERLPAAIAAILIVSIIGVITGPFAGNANPVLWRTVDFLFGRLVEKLDKTNRTTGELVTRGTIITIMAMGMAFLLGAAFQALSEEYNDWKMAETAGLCLILSSGAGWFALNRLYKAVTGKNAAKGAFYTIATTSRTNLAANDEYTITRVGIGMGARLYDKAIIAPVLWYLIGGLPVAYLYAGLAALCWRFGKEGFTKGFGSTALALEKLMGLIPNAFAGFLIAMAGVLTPTAGMARSLLGLIPGRAGKALYFEGGAVVTAMAYALKVSLGGATQDLDGSAIRRSWAGPKNATARLDAKHLHRGLYILVMAHILFITALLFAILLNGFIEGYGFFD